MVSSSHVIEIVLAALAVVAAVFAVTTFFIMRAKDAKTLEALEHLRQQLPRAVASELVLAASEGSDPSLSVRRSYLMQLPSAAPLPGAERDVRQAFALKVRGVAHDIGVLSDAYCAGPADDAPDPAKLGFVLGRWEDRLVAVADELDEASVEGASVEGEEPADGSEGE